MSDFAWMSWFLMRSHHTCATNGKLVVNLTPSLRINSPLVSQEVRRDWPLRPRWQPRTPSSAKSSERPQLQEKHPGEPCNDNLSFFRRWGGCKCLRSVHSLLCVGKIYMYFIIIIFLGHHRAYRSAPLPCRWTLRHSGRQLETKLWCQRGIFF